MKFENTEVFNFEGALRGMRNPKKSWDKSDSGRCIDVACCRCPKENSCDENYSFSIGKNDLELAQKLIKAGSEHRKFMRQIFVSVDITAPLYWWKEFDTYKVGIVVNSTSTMHKLADTSITKECFEMDDFENIGEIEEADGYFCIKESDNEFIWKQLILYLEVLRRKYNQTKDKHYWKELIRLLPESWLQKRTVTMDYENILAMCSKGQRRFHKLTEWSEAFIGWARSLPYAQELIFLDETME